MPDLQRVFPDYDSVDQQLQDPLPLCEGRLVEPVADSSAERLEVCPDGLRRLPLGVQSLFLVTLCCKDMSMPLNFLATCLQLGQIDHLSLISVDQPLFLPVEPLQLQLPTPDLALAVLPGL
ncbi:hypothetical protein [Singulisphaera sp. Ch08]|uniref:hypothetical protein n=1 Tax=Singulisphaera sp. Ch08 TaxID=3120278 RepID=UPI00387380CE